MKRLEVIAAFKSALSRHPEGLTPEKAAAVVGVPLRTARRHLLDLHLTNSAVRVATYTGNPPVFAWLYRSVA